MVKFTRNRKYLIGAFCALLVACGSAAEFTQDGAVSADHVASDPQVGENLPSGNQTILGYLEGTLQPQETQLHVVAALSQMANIAQTLLVPRETLNQLQYQTNSEVNIGLGWSTGTYDSGNYRVRVNNASGPCLSFGAGVDAGVATNVRARFSNFRNENNESLETSLIINEGALPCGMGSDSKPAYCVSYGDLVDQDPSPPYASSDLACRPFTFDNPDNLPYAKFRITLISDAVYSTADYRPVGQFVSVNPVNWVRGIGGLSAPITTEAFGLGNPEDVSLELSYCAMEIYDCMEFNAPSGVIPYGAPFQVSVAIVADLLAAEFVDYNGNAQTLFGPYILQPSGLETSLQLAESDPSPKTGKIIVKVCVGTEAQCPLDPNTKELLDNLADEEIINGITLSKDSPTTVTMNNLDPTGSSGDDLHVQFIFTAGHAPDNAISARDPYWLFRNQGVIHGHLENLGTPTETGYIGPLPLANAGPDQSVTWNGSQVCATLDGTDSTDLNGGSITDYHWTWIEGSAQSATGSTPSVCFNSGGIFAITLDVTDSLDLHSDPDDTLMVTVFGPPISNAGGDVSTTGHWPAGQACATLDGSASADPDGGSIAAYHWTWTDGSAKSATGASPRVCFGSSGTFTVTLDVTDDEGVHSTADDTVLVTVPSTNPPGIPVAVLGGNGLLEFTVTPDAGASTATVQLDGSPSFDTDGSIIFYEWLSGVGNIGGAESAIVTFQLPADQTHFVTFQVYDNAMNVSNIIEITIHVDPANQAPTANAGADQSIKDCDGNGSEPVTLNGSGQDSDGTISSFQWKEGATVLGSSAAISPTLSVAAHTLTLTVTDNQGATGADSLIATVTANTGPTANAGPDQNIDTGGPTSANVTLNGSSSTDNCAVTSYTWKKGSTTLCAASSSPTCNVTLSVGNHTVTLTAKDAANASATDTVVITVSNLD